MASSTRRLSGYHDVSLTTTTSEDGSWVSIAFQDHGPGFSTEVLGNLFQPFVTTRPDGNGLGLTIMREVCLLHGGDLEVENTGSGALVTATLAR